MSHDLQTYDVLTAVSSDPVENLMVALCEQAHAAHLNAGLGDAPFHVQLPSRDTPFFAVQSFGRGFDREHLKDIYCGNSAQYDVEFAVQAMACYDYCSNFFVTTVENDMKVEASFWRDVFADNTEALMLGPIAKDGKEKAGFRVSTQIKLIDVDHFLAVSLDVLPNYNVTISYDGEPFELPALAAKREAARYGLPTSVTL